MIEMKMHNKKKKIRKIMPGEDEYTSAGNNYIADASKNSLSTYNLTCS